MSIVVKESGNSLHVYLSLLISTFITWLETCWGGEVGQGSREGGGGGGGVSGNSPCVYLFLFNQYLYFLITWLEGGLARGVEDSGLGGGDILGTGHYLWRGPAYISGIPEIPPIPIFPVEIPPIPPIFFMDREWARKRNCCVMSSGPRNFSDARGKCFFPPPPVINNDRSLRK